DEGLRLSDMVSDLLNISRIESGKERLKFTEIDFREIIDHIRKAFAEEIERKDITFDSIIEGDIGIVYADRDKIIQVLSNLTDNSIKYSNSGCRIAVRVYAEDNYVIIEHTDTGWGIPEKDLQHIGERFYRGKHGEKTKGTGLGLTLSKEIINLHGGTMQINSKFGVGTSVIITLPKGRYELTEPIIPGGLNAKGNGD
ncbi:MAG TPA: HAMP domain-containing histidine kinase, partial [Nitrospirae bacterium]|nr:HAMP domain-containing histidine kinase [Nitrospirota bacterium]